MMYSRGSSPPPLQYSVYLFVPLAEPIGCDYVCSQMFIQFQHSVHCFPDVGCALLCHDCD